MKIVEIEGHDLSYFFMGRYMPFPYFGKNLGQYLIWHHDDHAVGEFLSTGGRGPQYSDEVVTGITFRRHDIPIGVVLLIDGNFHVSFIPGVNMDHIFLMVRVGKTLTPDIIHLIDMLP